MKLIKSEWRKSNYGEYEYIGDRSNYNEEDNAEVTSRLLDGSRDHGYYCEYIGRGYINNVPVIAVYLIDEDDYKDGLPDDEGDYNWDEALSNGRIIIDIDALSDDDYESVKQQLQ